MTDDPGGWVVRDLKGLTVRGRGGRAVAAGRTADEAIDRAEAMGAMPLRARIERASTACLDELARELPPALLGLEPGRSPWWRASPEAKAGDKRRRVRAAAARSAPAAASSDRATLTTVRDLAAVELYRKTVKGIPDGPAVPLAAENAAPAPEDRPAWLKDVATGEDLAALRRRLAATEDGLARLATALERRLP